MTFILWKREIKYYELAIGRIESERAAQDSIKIAVTSAETKKMAAAKIKATAYDSANIVKGDGYTIDYSSYGGKKNAEAYMRSMKFGSVTVVGSGGLDNHLPSGRISSKKERTQHVSAYTRRSKSGKTTYVKTYNRSPRGYSRKTSRQRRR